MFMPANPTSSVVLDQIVKELIMAAGGDPDRWREIIGLVHAFPPVGASVVNWAVVPGGSPLERTAIFGSVKKVQARHPVVRP